MEHVLDLQRPEPEARDVHRQVDGQGTVEQHAGDLQWPALGVVDAQDMVVHHAKNLQQPGALDVLVFVDELHMEVEHVLGPQQPGLGTLDANIGR